VKRERAGDLGNAQCTARRRDLFSGFGLAATSKKKKKTAADRLGGDLNDLL